jgi:chromosome segregation ATPase
MSRRATWAALALAALAGAGAGTVAAWAYWGRRAAAASARLAALESSAAEVHGERERLRRELADIVRERRDMAATAEHLRVQVEEQLHRLETLSERLAPPAAEGEPAPP